MTAHIKTANTVTSLRDAKAQPDYGRELDLAIHVNGLPKMLAEFAFCPTRKFRADRAYPTLKLLIEIEGGAWVGGRHTQGAGFTRDMEKYNIAQLMGYRVYRIAPKMIVDGTAITLIKRAYANALAEREATKVMDALKEDENLCVYATHPDGCNGAKGTHQCPACKRWYCDGCWEMALPLDAKSFDVPSMLICVNCYYKRYGAL